MSDVLGRLQGILNKADISDDRIVAGLRLTRKGEQTLAARLGISAKAVSSLLDALSVKLSDERTKAHAITEGEGGALTYEGPDFLGNVTIRDSDTGYEVYLSGSKASGLIRELDTSEDDQLILSKYFSLTESDEADFDIEDITSGDGGSYNFAYSVGRLKGTGTARFSGAGKNFTVKVISVRDETGSEIHPSAAQASLIHDAAVEFIDRA